MAGKQFIEIVNAAKPNLQYMLTSFIQSLMDIGVTSKQAIVGAYILLADRLAHPIFGDGLVLAPEDVAKYLRKNNDTSAVEMVVASIYSELVANRNHFNVSRDAVNFDIWGVETKQHYLLLISKFDELSKRMGFNKSVVRSYLLENNLTFFDKGSSSHTAKVNGKNARTIPFLIDPPFLEERS